jgi:hypothetical protein
MDEPQAKVSTSPPWPPSRNRPGWRGGTWALSLASGPARGCSQLAVPRGRRRANWVIYIRGSSDFKSIPYDEGLGHCTAVVGCATRFSGLNNAWHDHQLRYIGRASIATVGITSRSADYVASLRSYYALFAARNSGVFASTAASETLRRPVLRPILPSSVASAAFGAGTVSCTERTAIGSDFDMASIFGRLSHSRDTVQMSNRASKQASKHRRGAYAASRLGCTTLSAAHFASQETKQRQTQGRAHART